MHPSIQHSNNAQNHINTITSNLVKMRGLADRRRSSKTEIRQFMATGTSGHDFSGEQGTTIHEQGESFRRIVVLYDKKDEKKNW